MNVDQIVRLVLARVTPLIDAAVGRAIAAAERRRASEFAIVPGQVIDVSGTTRVLVQTDDAENGEETIYATRTGAQVRGDRVLVLFVRKGAAYAIGVIPQS